MLLLNTLYYTYDQVEYATESLLSQSGANNNAVSVTRAKISGGIKSRIYGRAAVDVVSRLRKIA